MALFPAAHHDNRASSHTFCLSGEKEGTILIRAPATVARTWACFCRASCKVGLSQAPIKTLLRNPSLSFSVTLLGGLSCETMCVLSPSPGFPSLICLCDKHSEHCQQSAHTHRFAHTRTDTHCGIRFPVCHTRQHVCFYLNHVLPPPRRPISYWSEPLTNTAVGLVGNEWNRKRRVFLLQDLHPKLTCRTNNASTESEEEEGGGKQALISNIVGI